MNDDFLDDDLDNELNYLNYLDNPNYERERLAERVEAKEHLRGKKTCKLCTDGRDCFDPNWLCPDCRKTMDAKEYLKSIGCFNTIFLKREKGSNTMAKIMENYANEVVKKRND